MFDGSDTGADKSFEFKNNCAFHQWSYRTFLWLMSPVKVTDKKPAHRVFEGLAFPKDLFDKKDGSKPKLEYPGRKELDESAALVRTQKTPASIDPVDVFQAGPGDNVLVDRAGNIIYYTTYIDKTYWDFVVKEGNEFYNLDKLQSAKSDTDFPTNALELKAAWRLAETLNKKDDKPTKVHIENADRRFYTTIMNIPGYILDKEGHIREDRKTTFRAKMALVGMHVTGVVQGHPEFIWATFEHVDNAPDCSSAMPAKSPNGHDWSFYTAGTPMDQCNKAHPAPDTGSGTLKPANVCRIFDPLPWSKSEGHKPKPDALKPSSSRPGDPTCDDKSNYDNIASLNDSMHKSLGPEDVLRNYVLGGAIWTDGSIPVNNGAFPPNAKEDAKQLGSCKLANTTMETFTQDQNCFACHNAGEHSVAVGDRAYNINAKDINLSHFIVNFQAARLSQTKSSKGNPAR